MSTDQLNLSYDVCLGNQALANVTDVHEGNHILETPYAKVSLVLVHAATLLALFALAKTLHARADVSHPVVAVVFQEAVLLFALHVAVYIILLWIVADYVGKWFKVFMVLSSLAAHFHQMTWCCVTLLRYYLLIIARDRDVDMSSLRRRCVWCLWAAVPCFAVLCQLPWLLTAVASGWPKRREHGYDLGWIGTERLLAAAAASLAVANIPDLVSIAVYAAMLRKFRVEPGADQPRGEEGNGNDGGSGEDGTDQGREQRDDDGGSGNDDGAEKDESGERSETAFGGGVWVSDANEVPAATAQASQTKSAAKVRKVLRHLRSHLATCLLDFALVLLALVLPDPYGEVALCAFQQICCFWVPIVVIKTNFRQLDGMCEYIFKWACN